MLDRVYVLERTDLTHCNYAISRSCVCSGHTACRIFSALPVCHEHTLGAVPDGLEFAATAAPVAPMFTHTNLQEPPRHERNDFGRAGIRIGSGRKRRRTPRSSSGTIRF